MINSFQPLSTITSGLILQQLEQEINANNLAQPSVDSNGYLMNSLEQVNSESNPSINFTGANGLLSIGTGASAESITSLRSSFLDSQIQQQSMTVGFNEILSNSNQTGIMNEINAILNGTGVTSLSSALTAFTTQWTTLAANPTNVSDQTNVVNAGVTFATAANSQYSQLQSLQSGLNTQVGETVSTVNDLLQQLGSINQQLLSTGGSNQNSLLDARDYALDLLSRQMNYQVAYGTNGTTTVWLGGIQLVNGGNVTELQEKAENPNNPTLVDITTATSSYLPSGTTPSSPYDLTASITGGDLGGELYARNVVVPSYMLQVDQIATSVLNMTNNLYEAGYVANGASTTTGTPFFMGTGAASISVNAVLSNDAATATSPFLATEIQTTSTPATGNTPLPSGTLAGFLGNMGSLLANNYIQSAAGINASGQTIDPTQTLATDWTDGTLATEAAPNPAPPATYQFTINGVQINYTTGTTINGLLNTINTQMAGSVVAVFNSTTQEFEMFSNGPITIQESGADNFTSWASIRNVLVSTIRMNNTDTTDNAIVASGVDSSFNSTLQPPPPPPSNNNSGPNSESFYVTPSSTGTFTVNGVQVSWNNTYDLTSLVLPSIKQAFTASGTGVTFTWLPTSQTVELQSKTGPITIYDDSGNFTVFTGLNGNLSLNNMASNVLASATSQNSSLQTAYTSSSASLTQLNNEQANLAGVSTTTTVNGVTTTTAGVPIATIEQQAEQSMITYNAMLEVMEVIDNMLDSLVGVASTTSSSGIFQQEQTS